MEEVVDKEEVVEEVIHRGEVVEEFVDKEEVVEEVIHRGEVVEEGVDKGEVVERSWTGERWRKRSWTEERLWWWSSDNKWERSWL